MPSDLLLKSVNAVHRTLFRVSNGKVAGKLGGMPVVELTTTGRKSGEPRTVMLTIPYEADGSYVLVASKGGDDDHPAWFLNIQTNPEVKVVRGGKDRTVTARIATAEERADIWPKITAKHKNYAGYQTKTEREIPLVLIDS
jgi:deazaflavin-dependent oxidoreductase (nitroreductase family)